MRIALLVIFALSGFSGLIYESVWSHYIAMIVGHAAYAQSLTLAVFMGGMAFGAWVVGKRSAQLNRPLLAYGIIELVIGIIGIAFHPLFNTLIDIYFEQFLPSAPSNLVAEIGRWGLSVLLILPQSILLGTTFPLMSRALMSLNRNRHGEMISLAYFSNSGGAVLGALCSGFYLLHVVGLPGTLLTAGMLNVFLGLVVYLIARSGTEDAATQAAPESRFRFRINIYIIGALITGLSSFIYEIAWIRMLNLTFGTTLHAFEIMLAIFISGISLGGLYIRKRIDHYQNPRAAIGMIQILMGLMAVFSLLPFVLSFEWTSFLHGFIQRSEYGYLGFNLGMALMAVLIMFPAAFFAGMTLPLFTLLQMEKTGSESAIGFIYSANTVGSIIGAIIATHLLLPLVTVRGALIIGGSLDVVLGLVLVFHVATKPKKSYRLASASCVLAFVLLALFANTDQRAMASGVFRHGKAGVSPDAEVVYYADGKTASVSVLKYEKKHHFVVLTNGKPDAGMFHTVRDTEASGDSSTMLLLAVLPLSVNDSEKNAAAIGFGSGITSAMLLEDPSIKQLTTIEIEQKMVDAGRFFRPVTDLVYVSDKSRIVIDDAKNFFAKSKTKFDLIVSEPSDPWVNGVGNLFSLEFYERVSQYLTDDGVLVQWINLYETEPRLVATVFNALGQHFSDYSVYATNPYNIAIMARKDGVCCSLNDRVFEIPNLEYELGRMGIDTLADLQAQFVADKQLIAPFAAELSKIANSDFFPVLTLESPRSRFLGASALSIARMSAGTIPAAQILYPDRFPQNGDQWSGSRFGIRGEGRKRALALLEVVNGMTPAMELAETTLPFVERLLLSNLLESYQSCADGVSDHSTRNRLTVWLASQMLAYLTNDESISVWSKFAQSPCVAGQDSTTHDLLLMLSELSARNFQQASDAAHRIWMNEEITDTEGKVLAGNINLLALFMMAEYEQVLTLNEAMLAGRKKQDNIAPVLVAYARAALTDSQNASVSAPQQ